MFPAHRVVGGNPCTPPLGSFSRSVSDLSYLENLNKFKQTETDRNRTMENMALGPWDTFGQQEQLSENIIDPAGEG